MKRFKGTIAIALAVVCLLASTLVPQVNTVKAEDYSAVLTEIYPSDFGIEDGSYSNVNEKFYTYSGDSLLNTVFTMDVKFSGASRQFTYAATGQWAGMLFTVNEDSITLKNNSGSYTVLSKSYTFTSDIAGTKFMNETFRLSISMEACDNDGDGTNNDIKIGIYFNHVLYNNTFIYADDATEEIGKQLRIFPKSGSKLSCYEVSSPKKTNSDNFCSLYPLDFGFSNGTYTGTQADINVGLDGKLFGTEVSFDNSGEYIDYAGIKLESDGFGGITISDSTGNNSFESEKIYTDISDLTPISYTDFSGDISAGVEDVGAYGKYKNGTTLNNTYFSAKFKFYPNGAQPQFLYGGGDSSGWAGIRIKYKHDVITVDNAKNSTVGYKIYPSDVSVGMTTFADGESSGWSRGIDIGISLRYGDYDGDGLNDDVQYGIFIMGKLAQNKYAYVMDYADTEDNTGSKMGIQCRLYCASVKDTDEETEEVTTYKSQIELADPISYPALDTEKFGLEIATRAVDNDTDSAKDDLEAKIYIDNTLFKTVVIDDYADKLSYKLGVNADIINPQRQLSYKNSVTSFTDLGIESGANENTSVSTKLDMETTKLVSGNVVLADGTDALLSLNEQSKLTFSDFGIADDTYTTKTKPSGSIGTTVDAYLFSGRVTIGGKFYYGGTAASKGIEFSLSGVKLIIKDAGGTTLDTITPSSTGGTVTSFKSEFLLGIGANVTDTDADGQRDDVRLGVWFNGVFYKSYNINDAASSLGGYVSAAPSSTASITLQSADMSFEAADILKVFEKVPEKTFDEISLYDVAEKSEFGFDLELKKLSLDDDRLKNDLALVLYIDGKARLSKIYKDFDFENRYLGFECESAELYDRLPEEDLSEKIYNLHQGDYALLGVGNITINRENGHLSGELIDTVGEYTIVRTYLGKEYAEKVQLWKTGYINSDAQVNVLDFIAAKKYMAGEIKSTFTRKGADLDFDGNVTARDIIKVKRILLGIDTVPETNQTDKWSFKEDEMPIVGYFSPKTMYLDAGSQDLTPDLCTDKIYKLISDLGINFMNYTESQYNELAYGLSLENKNCTIKNLELASKYGIGSIVWLAGSQNENTYLDLISRFSHYSAFSGVYIIDEPETPYYYERKEGKVPVDEFTSAENKYKLMASYTNTYGYANLFPYALSMTGKDNSEEGYEVYRQYMREFCERFNPKVLSWDHYVLNNKPYKNYYKMLQIGSEVAKEFGIPFWTFMQAGDTAGRTGSTATTTTTEEMLWNLNTMLAYGAKGIQYYTLMQRYSAAYVDSTDGYDFDASGLIAVNGEKTKYYDQAIAVNNQVKAVDHVLINSDSKAVLAIGETAQTETGLSATSYGCLTGATATAARGAIIGCFDYRGKQAFYVASNSFEENQTVTLSFDTAHSLELIADGLNETRTGDSCTLELEKGKGVLIVVD